MMYRKPKKLYFSILLIWAAFFVLNACKKDKLYNSSDAQLNFLTDTLTFDTVFVSLGSTTKYFTVRNTYNNILEVQKIYLKNGTASSFRLTVDGDPVATFGSVRIPANDSVYVFVEVTVNPNDEQLPFLIEDAVVFETNGNRQEVVLQAYGQNAHFFNGETIQTQTWTNDLPYVILNSLEVEAGHTLTIQEGVQVYFGGASGLFVNGTLKINGGQDTSRWVTFRGYRLDRQVTGMPYDQLPGQWLGVFLMRGSKGHEIRNWQMRGSQFGLNVGNTTLEDLNQVSKENAPDLKISNSLIKNSSTYGIFGFLANIQAENILIHDVGSNAFCATLGGDYQLDNSTFYLRTSNFFDHKQPAVYVSNYHVYDKSKPALLSELKSRLTNCIIYGTAEEELLVDVAEGAAADYIFRNCLLKIKGSLPAIPNFEQCITNTDPKFTDISRYNFRPSEGSPLIDAGVSNGVLTDLDGKPRGSVPDIGAYEF